MTNLTLLVVVMVSIAGLVVFELSLKENFEYRTSNAGKSGLIPVKNHRYTPKGNWKEKL